MGTIKVKPLEWSEPWCPKESSRHDGAGVGHHYWVDPTEDGKWQATLGCFGSYGTPPLGPFDTLDEAKAASDADYVRRVLSAIEA